MKLSRLFLPIALALAGAAFAQERAPEAVAVAEEMMAAMGGQDAWNNTRFVRFDFKVGKPGEWRVDRAHLWDKWEGRYRFETPVEGGGVRVVLFNVNTKQGDVYLDGRPVAGAEKTEALEGAYSAYINDMYWLAMPWKWLDPGVNLAYGGEQEYDGKACDVVNLSFGNVGLTPGDRYKAFVSKDSRLMVHWEYTLQSDRTGSWDWQYVDAGGVKLAKTHVNDEGTEINMGAVKTAAEMDAAYFTDPAKSIR